MYQHKHELQPNVNTLKAVNLSTVVQKKGYHYYYNGLKNICLYDLSITTYPGLDLHYFSEH